MKEKNVLYVTHRHDWRSWLSKNSQEANEIWLLYYKKNSGKPRIPYEDAVEEAICFGWIDEKIKRLDENRFAQRFAPRRPNSKWSTTNIHRAKKMIAEGRMTKAGLKVFDPRRKAAAGLPTRLPKKLENHFRNQSVAWENFNQFPPSYKKICVGWVASAKKDETKLKRLTQVIVSSAENKRIKFM